MHKLVTCTKVTFDVGPDLVGVVSHFVELVPEHLETPFVSRRLVGVVICLEAFRLFIHRVIGQMDKAPFSVQRKRLRGKADQTVVANVPEMSRVQLHSCATAWTYS